MCRVGQDAGRGAPAAIDVGHGWAYARTVRGAYRYNPHIAQTVPQCSSDARLREPATSVVLLRTIDLMCRATCTAFSRTFVPSHDT